MISEFLLNILFGIADKIFGFLPQLAWTPGGAALNFITDCVAAVVYLFPMRAVIGIIEMSVALLLIRIVISFLRTLWDVLPVV